MGKGLKRLLILNFMMIMAVTGYWFGRYVLGEYITTESGFVPQEEIMFYAPE